MLFNLGTVFFRFAFADHQDCYGRGGEGGARHSVRAVLGPPIARRRARSDAPYLALRLFAMELLQLRRERVARATVWAGEDQQHLPPAQVVQRQLAAPVQSRQSEVGRGGAGFQAVALELAARERPLAETVGSVSINFPVLTRSTSPGSARSQREQSFRAHRQFAGDFSLGTDQITRGRAVGLVGGCDLRLFLKQ